MTEAVAHLRPLDGRPGIDLTAESLRDTAGRMARMYTEMLTPAPFAPTTFPNGGGYDELVVATGIHDAGRRLVGRASAPRGVGVVLEAEHFCKSLRGVQKPGTRTVTSALHGRLRDDQRTRQEFLCLTGGSRV